MKRFVFVVVLTLIAMLGRPQRAEAQFGGFSDAPAFAQRISQLATILIQWNSIISTARGHLAAFQKAYKGLKDWKNLTWGDTLGIVDSPWFDGVDGIDEIRKVSYLTVMTGGQLSQLWSNLDTDWTQSSRYKTDPWFRAKVDSMTKASKRARATRVAVMRQMQSQNAALTKDITKMKALRDAIEAENKAADSENRPVNQGLVTSLQAELQALEAKYKGQELMLKNQQALMFMVGAEDAQRVYLETRDQGWVKANSSRIRDFGKGLR